ncbi:MAG: hypothetical protein IT542_05850 [Rubellimicrobium sp.]|nr:hypothetical protein [Rubellimicrobium sp.]
MAASQDGGDGGEAAGPRAWVAVWLGLLAVALVWAWGVALLSGCAVPWDCGTAGRFVSVLSWLALVLPT